MIKRRGKLGLIKVKIDYSTATKWIEEKRSGLVKIGNTEGNLKRFIIEPFLPHTEEQEMYCAIFGTKMGDRILFYHQGGVDIGDVDEKATAIDIGIVLAFKSDKIISFCGFSKLYVRNPKL